MAATGMIGVGAVLALLALVAGSQSTVGSGTKKPDVKPYDQGLFDGANDCSSGKANSPDPAAAKASGDVDQYKAGYAKGYASCASTPAGKPSYACITPTAGMTLAQAQMALASLEYTITDELGVCGANTTSAIRTFQGDNGLVVDGLIGPATAAKLKAKADAGKYSGEAYSYTTTDANGTTVKWGIKQLGVNLWRGQPIDPPTPDYNTYRDAPNSYALQASIDAFVASIPAVGTAGRRARYAPPHVPRQFLASPFAGRRPAFPPYVRMM